MTDVVDAYVAELAAAVRCRGRARRRLLDETRDHLTEAGAAVGPETAVRRFGSAADLAAAWDTEIAVRRALLATVATAVGVLGVGASALVMIHGSDPRAAAPVAWAVAFFAAAQVAAACLALALVRAAAMRRAAVSAGDVRVLCRRDAVALAAALVSMFAVGAALPGHASAAGVLSGPVLALAAGWLVLRAQLLVRRIAAPDEHPVHAPVEDVVVVVRQGAEPGPWARSPWTVLPPTVVVAAVAAFAWDHLDHGSLASSGRAAVVESALTLAGFLLLGGFLGIRDRVRVGPSA